MDTHERFIEAVTAAIPNPSPAIAAYLANYRANLAGILSADDEVFDQTISSGIDYWAALTPDEKQLLLNIHKGV